MDSIKACRVSCKTHPHRFLRKTPCLDYLIRNINVADTIAKVTPIPRIIKDHGYIIKPAFAAEYFFNYWICLFSNIIKISFESNFVAWVI